jgi:hypothetical protein
MILISDSYVTSPYDQLKVYKLTEYEAGVSEPTTTEHYSNRHTRQRLLYNGESTSFSVSRFDKIIVTKILLSSKHWCAEIPLVLTFLDRQNRVAEPHTDTPKTASFS